MTVQRQFVARDKLLAVRVRPWMLVSAAWIAPAILGFINEVAQGMLSREPHVNVRAALFAGLDWLLYALLTPAVFAISARWPLTRPHLRTRVPLHLAISLLDRKSTRLNSS